MEIHKDDTSFVTIRSASENSPPDRGVEEWLVSLDRLKSDLHGDGAITPLPLEKLATYYEHLAELAKGYEKDKAKLEENLRQVYGWRDEVKELKKLL